MYISWLVIHLVITLQIYWCLVKAGWHFRGSIAKGRVTVSFILPTVASLRVKQSLSTCLPRLPLGSNRVFHLSYPGFPYGQAVSFNLPTQDSLRVKQSLATCLLIVSWPLVSLTHLDFHLAFPMDYDFWLQFYLKWPLICVFGIMIWVLQFEGNKNLLPT